MCNFSEIEITFGENTLFNWLLVDPFYDYRIYADEILNELYDYDIASYFRESFSGCCVDFPLRDVDGLGLLLESSTFFKIDSLISNC